MLIVSTILFTKDSKKSDKAVHPKQPNENGNGIHNDNDNEDEDEEIGVLNKRSNISSIGSVNNQLRRAPSVSGASIFRVFRSGHGGRQSSMLNVRSPLESTVLGGNAVDAEIASDKGMLSDRSMPL